MDKEGQAFTAVLITLGRKTRKEHAVPLRAVIYEGIVYFTRHRPDSDWYQNALACPQVRVRIEGREYAGTASQITDRALESKVSELKYPKSERAGERRVGIGVRLCGL